MGEIKVPYTERYQYHFDKFLEDSGKIKDFYKKQQLVIQDAMKGMRKDKNEMLKSLSGIYGKYYGMRVTG